ncbi:MAG TPA: Rieske (2Fe-2S) protein [Myxococcales bacterium]|nr:Rieske (2Fe-2S) protein [Myxococcales bacterium]
MNRRKLLATLTAGAGVAAAGAAVWPLAAGASDTEGAPPADAPWVDVGAERDLHAGPPLKADLRAPVRDGFFTTLLDLGAAWLLRTDAGITALSATCPHLGCGIQPRTDGVPGFGCPCHDSRFRPDGELEKGPAARGMDPLPVRVVAGRVQVQAVRFAPGSASRRRV